MTAHGQTYHDHNVKLDHNVTHVLTEPAIVAARRSVRNHGHAAHHNNSERRSDPIVSGHMLHRKIAACNKRPRAIGFAVDPSDHPNPAQPIGDPRHSCRTSINAVPPLGRRRPVMFVRKGRQYCPANSNANADSNSDEANIVRRLRLSNDNPAFNSATDLVSISAINSIECHNKLDVTARPVLHLMRSVVHQVNIDETSLKPNNVNAIWIGCVSVPMNEIAPESVAIDRSVAITLEHAT